MNEVILIGRLTADPEVRWTSGDNPTAVARYTLAVDRKYKKDSEQTADFIRCVGFGKGGEFAKQYLRKGVKIAVRGSLRTGQYTNRDGIKVYTTEVVVESHEFCESRKDNPEDLPAGNASGAYNPAGAVPAPAYAVPEFAELTDDDAQLPF